MKNPFKYLVGILLLFSCKNVKSKSFSQTELMVEVINNFSIYNPSSVFYTIDENGNRTTFNLRNDRFCVTEGNANMFPDKKLDEITNWFRTFGEIKLWQHKGEKLDLNSLQDKMGASLYKCETRNIFKNKERTYDDPHGQFLFSNIHEIDWNGIEVYGIGLIYYCGSNCYDGRANLLIRFNNEFKIIASKDLFKNEIR